MVCAGEIALGSSPARLSSLDDDALCFRHGFGFEVVDLSCRLMDVRGCSFDEPTTFSRQGSDYRHVI